MKIVVDMPSSGFIKRFLSVPRVVSEAVKVGPLAKDATLVQQYFADAKNALLHLVAAPEELIVKETSELYNEMRNAGDVALGLLFINRYPVYREYELNEIYRSASPDDSGICSLMAFLLARARRTEKELSKLHELGLKEVRIEEQWGEVLQKRVIVDIERALGNAS